MQRHRALRRALHVLRGFAPSPRGPSRAPRYLRHHGAAAAAPSRRPGWPGRGSSPPLSRSCAEIDLAGQRRLLLDPLPRGDRRAPRGFESGSACPFALIRADLRGARPSTRPPFERLLHQLAQLGLRRTVLARRIDRSSGKRAFTLRPPRQPVALETAIYAFKPSCCSRPRDHSLARIGDRLAHGLAELVGTSPSLKYRPYATTMPPDVGRPREPPQRTAALAVPSATNARKHGVARAGHVEHLAPPPEVPRRHSGQHSDMPCSPRGSAPRRSASGHGNVAAACSSARGPSIRDAGGGRGLAPSRSA